MCEDFFLPQIHGGELHRSAFILDAFQFATVTQCEPFRQQLGITQPVTEAGVGGGIRRRVRHGQGADGFTQAGDHFFAATGGGRIHHHPLALGIDQQRGAARAGKRPRHQLKGNLLFQIRLFLAPHLAALFLLDVLHFFIQQLLDHRPGQQTSGFLVGAENEPVHRVGHGVLPLERRHKAFGAFGLRTAGLAAVLVQNFIQFGHGTGEGFFAHKDSQVLDPHRVFQKQGQ